MAVAKKTERLSSGLALFEGFLAENQLSQVAAGKSLGVSGVTVHSWLNGTKRPSFARRQAIETWTRGVVPADSWRFDDEESLEVQPYTPGPVSGPQLPAVVDDDAA